MFEITILQETLMVVLNYLDPTIGKNSQGLGDDCISMTATDNGSCVFYTTNMNEFTVIEAICSNSTKQSLSPYVNFKRLKGIIQTINPTEYVTMKASANELLITFSMRKTPIKIVGNTTGMIPIPTITLAANLPANMVDVPMSFFNTAVTKAASIIQDSNTVQLMNCIKLTIGNPDITAEAIDVTSKRTFMVSDKTGTAPVAASFLIEASKMQKSLKLFEDFTDIELGSDNSMTLIKGNVSSRPALYNRKHPNPSSEITSIMYCIRQLSGQFPNVAQYYTQPYQPLEYMTINKEDVLNSIARIRALGDSNTALTGINLKADKNEFSISFASSYGELDDPIDVTTPIKGSFGMIFNHKELEDVIKNIPTDYIDIGLMKGATGNFIIKGSTNNSSPYAGTDMFTMLSKVGQQTP